MLIGARANRLSHGENILSLCNAFTAANCSHHHEAPLGERKFNVFDSISGQRVPVQCKRSLSVTEYQLLSMSVNAKKGHLWRVRQGK